MEAENMTRTDREHTDAELSLENAQFRFANLCRAAYDEGYKKGAEIGRREARVEVASNMLKYGADTEFIKKYTHLSDAEIAELQK